MYNTLYVDADEAGVSSSLSNISGQSYGGPVSVPGQLGTSLCQSRDRSGHKQPVYLQLKRLADS